MPFNNHGESTALQVQQKTLLQSALCGILCNTVTKTCREVPCVRFGACYGQNRHDRKEPTPWETLESIFSSPPSFWDPEWLLGSKALSPYLFGPHSSYLHPSLLLQFFRESEVPHCLSLLVIIDAKWWALQFLAHSMERGMVQYPCIRLATTCCIHSWNHFQGPRAPPHTL